MGGSKNYSSETSNHMQRGRLGKHVKDLKTTKKHTIHLQKKFRLKGQTSLGQKNGQSGRQQKTGGGESRSGNLWYFGRANYKRPDGTKPRTIKTTRKDFQVV